MSEGTCGNNICEGIETPESCPPDCDTACGDGVCIDRESPESCPQDCNFTAGDGLCAAGENPVNSPADCAGQTLGQPCEGDADCRGAVCDESKRCNCDESQGGTCATTTCGDGYCQSYESSFRCPADCCGVDPNDEQRRPGPSVCTQEGTYCAGNRVVECRLAGAGNCPDLLSTQVCEFGCLDGQCLPCPLDLPGVVFCSGPELQCDGERSLRQCEPFPGVAGCWYQTTVDCVDVVGLDPAGMLPTLCTARGCSIGCPDESPQGQTRCTPDGTATEVWTERAFGSVCPSWVRESECGEEGRCTQAGPQTQAVCGPIQAANLVSILPNAGVIASEVRLIGGGLGSERGTVTFTPNVRAFVTFWSDGQLNVRVPEGAVTGPVTVTTAEGRVVSAPEPFTVEASEPVLLTALATFAGRPGDPLFLYGQHFGTSAGQVVFWTSSPATRDDNTLALGVVAEVLAWDDQIVQVRVPPVCGPNFRGEDVCGPFLNSTVILRTAEDLRASSFQTYTVKAHATSVEVCGAPRGEPYDLATVHGYGFGTAQAPKVTGLRFGEVDARAWVLDDEHMVALVPLEAVTGAVSLFDEGGWSPSGSDFEVLPLERTDFVGMASYPMPDSPTALCSDGEAVIDCADAPLQDGARLAPSPDLAVVGEVLEDRVTGLMWQVTPSAPLSRLDAQCACRELSLGGYDDWRLPWTVDLVSLIDFGAPQASAFPSELVAGDGLGLWTRQPANGAPSSLVFTVVGRAGQVSAVGVLDATGTGVATRCVRGGPEALPRPRFVLEGELVAEQTVTDQWTGLMWEVFDAAYVTWQEALVHCDTLERGGYTDWRLASVKELTTLEDFDRLRPQPWPSLEVPSIPLSNLWTSSVTGATRAFPWAVNLNNGDTTLVNQLATSRLFPMCVRDAR